MSPVLFGVIAIALAWLAQAVAAAMLMSRIGFHPLPWFALTLLLGPAMWPALVEARSGPAPRRLLRRGASGSGSLDLPSDQRAEVLGASGETQIVRCRRDDPAA